MTTSTINLACNAEPLLLFIELLKRALQVTNRRFDLGNLEFELARIESNFSAASACELGITLYPSDAFFDFAVAIFAGDFDFSFVDKSSHSALSND